MKRGYLERFVDVSGVSGIGNIAEVCISSNGRVAVFWPPPNESVASFPNVATLLNVHGHQGKTRLVLLDDPELDWHCDECHQPNTKCPFHLECPSCLGSIK